MEVNEVSVKLETLALARFVVAKVMAYAKWERLPDDDGILFHLENGNMILEYDELSIIDEFLSKSPLLGEAQVAINEMLTEE